MLNACDTDETFVDFRLRDGYSGTPDVYGGDFLYSYSCMPSGDFWDLNATVDFSDQVALVAWLMCFIVFFAVAFYPVKLM